MSQSAEKRLMEDYRKLREDKSDRVSASPSDDSLLKWNAKIFGPEHSPYKNGVFKAIIYFPEQYPILPPKVVFVSKMFHPNIFKDGKVCVDLLNEHWNSAYDVSLVLLVVYQLLAEPNSESPANVTASNMLVRNYQEYAKEVELCVQASLDNL